MAGRVRISDSRGFTLIEVMVAAFVLMLAVITTATMIDSANRGTVTARERVVGINLAREIIETARGLSYDRITNSGLLAAIGASDASLADSEGGAPHTIRRNGVTYTLAGSVCIMDDPRDGGGTQAGGSFCPDSAPENMVDPRRGTVDRVPEDYKRVSIVIEWKTRGPRREVRQTEVINNPGSAAAPAVTALSATNPALGNPPQQVSNPAITRIDFSATTSTAAAQVSWMLDGTNRGLATGSGTAWGFSWDIGAVGAPNDAADGPYLVGVEAYDKYGVSGSARSMTVVLNRSMPGAPRGFAGGRNDGRVEMEWLPNPERDLAGYQVFRGTTLICPLSFSTYCADPSPPAGTLTYEVRAYDRDPAGVLRYDTTAGFSRLDVVPDNRPPFNPVPLGITVNTDGSTTIRWAKPSPEDPDTGDSIAFYRVYRDGTAITNRYARVDATGTTHSFTDEPRAGVRAYFVSAVDRRYGESAKVEVP